MEFVLLTYNIWFSDTLINERVDCLIKLLNNLSVDILCLQEVRPDVLAILVNKLTDKYKYWETTLDENASYGEAIFSKYKILDKQIFQYKKTNMNRHFIITSIELNDNYKINISTTHLESEFIKKKNTDTDDKIEQEIKKSIKYNQYMSIMNYLKDFDNIILCGDFNINKLDEKYFLLMHKWKDAWIENGKNKLIENTYDCYNNAYINKKTRYISRLDRVYYNSDNLQLIDMNLVGNNKKEIIPSDHFGILCRFLW
tara:strand:- start:2240 stop:3007 length:768 start_codon:yes stop_codon:yes gene_type:complete